MKPNNACERPSVGPIGSRVPWKTMCAPEITPMLHASLWRGFAPNHFAYQTETSEALGVGSCVTTVHAQHGMSVSASTAFIVRAIIYHGGRSGKVRGTFFCRSTLPIGHNG